MEQQQLVHELDVLLNGETTAQLQPRNLEELVAQVRARNELAVKLANQLEKLGVTRPEWSKSALHYFSHSGGTVSLGAVDNFFKEAVSLAERTAKFLRLK